MTYEIHEPSELDLEQQIQPLDDLANLARALNDGELLEAADFEQDGTPKNAPARELQRRWRCRPIVQCDLTRFSAEEAREIREFLASPAVVDGVLMFRPFKESTQ